MTSLFITPVAGGLLRARRVIWIAAFCWAGALAAGFADQAQRVTQYGITWTFDKPYTVGQFVTGDYWVLGPVTITSVSPTPGPAPAGTGTGAVKSRYGAAAMKDDSRMRNGSMIVLKPDKSQGYDSRLVNYDPSLSVAFPCTLPTNQSLISTISNETFPVPVLLHDIMWKSEAQGSLALQSAAILTCLDKAPPTDAFRPPYCGTDKPIYETKDLKWDILPKLAVPPPVSPPPGATEGPGLKTPDFALYERYFQRPWLDHIDSWLLQDTGPSENQVNYGREFLRTTATASLLLMLDVPQEQKQKLMIGLVQFGIDLEGLAKNGREWTADGGHWNGRKWPILFAGMMLGNKEMETMSPGKPLFSEDQQTYYGKGWAGQPVLYQMVFHTQVISPYEGKDPATWQPLDKKSEGYRGVNSPAWAETALAVLLLKGKQLWDHDAFFDYADRWMAKDDAYADKRGATPRPKAEGSTFDPFDDAMWAAYRSTVPDQPGGADNMKWVWTDPARRVGEFQPNPKGSQ
jgi:hypothetical protein